MDRALHPPAHAVREAVARAIAEDLTPLGDLSAALVPSSVLATATFVARQPGVLAGTACATEAFLQIDPALSVQWTITDGARIEPGARLGSVHGQLASILVQDGVELGV